jgi:uncharacterized OB-fold protein
MPSAGEPTLAKPAVPVVAGWFTTGEQPRLIGSRCTACGSYFFPKQLFFCPNPRCGSRELDEVELSREGTIWSYTNNCFAPPPPYVAPEPFEPYAVAAVELGPERMTILGQVARGVDVADLAVGMPVELVVEPLYEDDEHEYLMWKWRPVPDGGAGAAAGAGGATGGSSQ